MPRGTGRIGWYLVWAVAFGSVGSSMYYVPGLLLHAAGPGAPALVGLLSIAFLALVLKEAELTRRHPSGGGAVSQVRETFGEAPAIAGGVLLLFDLALTIAVSVLAGVEQLDAAVPLGSAVAAVTLVWLGVVVAANVIGVRGVVTTGLGIGLVALALNATLLALVALGGGSTPEPFVLSVHSGNALGLGWLAFSGIEVCALLSPAMKEWGSTPTRALTALGVAVLATGPWLMWVVGGLPHELLRSSRTHLLPELGLRVGGPGLSLLVAAAGAGLLFFAAHAALTASYQVQQALVNLRAWPSQATSLSSRFQTPARAVWLAGLLAAGFLILSGFNVRTLGLLYALAFTGSIGLGSAAMDVQRWRDGKRGVLTWLGVVVTLALLAGAAGIAVTEPWTLGLLGGALALALLATQSVRSGAWAGLLARIPGATPPVQVLRNDVAFSTLAQVRAATAAARAAGQARGGILVASRGADPRVFAEAVDRARARGLEAIYVVYVDEVPGLLYPQQGQPTAEGLRVLAASCSAVGGLGMTAIPVWAMSHSAAVSVAEAVDACGCDTVIIGATQRTVVWQALRGRFVQDLKLAVPTEVRITVVG